MGSSGYDVASGAISIGRLDPVGFRVMNEKTTITMLKPKPKQTLNILISKSKSEISCKKNCGQHATSEIISGASPESSSSSIETAFARGDFRDVVTLRAMSISEGTETRLHFLRDATSLTQCFSLWGRHGGDLAICVDFGSIVICGSLRRRGHHKNSASPKHADLKPSWIDAASTLGISNHDADARSRASVKDN